MQRKGIKPRDHMKENSRNLKAAQRRNQMDREEAARPQKELYKLPQFKEAQARVFDAPEVSPRKGYQDNYLARGASEQRRQEQINAGREARRELDRKMRQAREDAVQPPSPRKASVPRDIAPPAKKNNENFIVKNKIKALTMKGPDQVEDYDVGAHHPEYGRVPDYLEERKAQWAAEDRERRRRAPDPEAPPGMCVMPEDERVATLNTLNNSKKECLNQLERMPFVIETPSMRRKQEGLEEKMREIENAIAIFSKRKVFVAIDR